MSGSLVEPQAESNGPGPVLTRRWFRAAPWVVFGIVFLLAVYVRCAGLCDRGIVMAEVDTWKYLQVAQDWSQGHYTWMGGGRFYRPVIHLIHGWLFRLFGVNDDVIKFGNVVFDCGTLVLILLLTRMLTRSTWAGVAATLLYAFVPNVIRNVWVEQHFSPSTCFILMSILLVILSQRMRAWRVLSLLLLALGGFVLGMAVNMHPDLMLLAPGVVIGIGWTTVARKAGHLTDRLVSNLAVFLGGLSGVYVLGVVFLGAKEVVSVASREFFEHTERYTRIAGETGYGGLLSRILNESFTGLLDGTRLMLCVFLGAVALAAILPLYRRVRTEEPTGGMSGECGVVLLPVLSYGLLFALTIGWFKSWLLFYPLYPLVVISVVYWYHRLFLAFVRPWSALAVMACALFVAWYNPHMTPGMIRQGVFAPDRLVAAHEFLRDRVDKNNRVLVMPTCDSQSPCPPHQPTAGLTSPVYLGPLATSLPEMADFRLPYTAESLRQACLKHHIRYILNLKTGTWAQEWTDKVLRQYPQFQMVGSWQPYSHETEQGVVQTFLTVVGATRVAAVEDGIFELPVSTSRAMKTTIDAPVAPFTPEIVHTTKLWDFRSLDPQSFEWAFPGQTRIKTPHGAISTLTCGELGYVDLRGVRLPADGWSGVWMEAMLDDKATEVLEQNPLPQDADVYLLWARDGDYSPGEFPYNLVRYTVMGRVNASEPLLFVATLKDRSTLWNGAISDIAVRFELKAGSIAGRQAHLIVRRIGFF